MGVPGRARSRPARRARNREFVPSEEVPLLAAEGGSEHFSDSVVCCQRLDCKLTRDTAVRVARLDRKRPRSFIRPTYTVICMAMRGHRVAQG